MFLATRVARSLVFSKFRLNSTTLSSVGQLRIRCRDFGTSANLCVKMFMEHENRHAYNILENKGFAVSLNIEPSKTSLSKDTFENLLKEDWLNKPASEIFETFHMISDYCAAENISIMNKMFDTLIDALTDKMITASDKELRALFYSLAKWPETPSIRSRNFIEIWAALDDACLNRLNSWSFDEMLSFVALFYMINVTRVSEFSKKCLQKLATKAKQLTPEQLVQTMFFICIMRREPYDMHNLEIFTDKHFDKFSIDDLAIMSMGFFKSRTPIRNVHLVTKIIDKVMQNSKSVNEVSLAALAKVIRYSLKINVEDKVYKLLDVLQHEVPRLSVMCNVHLALLGTTTLTLHEGSLTKIAVKIIDSITEARLKDLERLILTYGTFNFINPTTKCLFQKVTEELRKPERQSEIDKHGRSYCCCVAYLSLLDIYPKDLMSKALDKNVLQSSYGKYCAQYGRETLTIHNSVEIFFKESEMNRLSDREAIILAKKLTDYVPNETINKQFNVTEKMFLDICNVLKEFRGGDDYVVGDHILTHHQRGDIIICNSPEGTPLKVKEAFNDSKFGLLRRPPDSNHWLVLVIVGRNAIIVNSDQPTGPFQTKIRELKALGFHGILVPWTTYSVLKTNEDKFGFLSNLINEALK